jgi:hypothetical protein
MILFYNYINNYRAFLFAVNKIGNDLAFSFEKQALNGSIRTTPHEQRGDVEYQENAVWIQYSTYSW